MAACCAVLSPVVSCSPIEKKRDQSGRARSGRGGRGQSLPFCFPPSHHPSRFLRSRFSPSTRVGCEQSLFSFRLARPFSCLALFPRGTKKKERLLVVYPRATASACASRIQKDKSELVRCPFVPSLKSPSRFLSNSCHAGYVWRGSVILLLKLIAF